MLEIILGFVFGLSIILNLTLLTRIYKDPIPREVRDVNLLKRRLKNAGVDPETYADYMEYVALLIEITGYGPRQLDDLLVMLATGEIKP